MQSKQQKRKKAVELLKTALINQEKNLASYNNNNIDDGTGEGGMREAEQYRTKIKNLKRMIEEGNKAIDSNGRY